MLSFLLFLFVWSCSASLFPAFSPWLFLTCLSGIFALWTFAYRICTSRRGSQLVFRFLSSCLRVVWVHFGSWRERPCSNELLWRFHHIFWVKFTNFWWRRIHGYWRKVVGTKDFVWCNSFWYLWWDLFSWFLLIPELWATVCLLDWVLTSSSVD